MSKMNKQFLLRSFLILLLVGLSFFMGLWWSSKSSMDHEGMTTTSERKSGEREILYWKAPMDSNYRRDKPGKSPMGMDLVPVYADEENGASDDSSMIKIKPNVINNLGVRSELVWRTSLEHDIDTVGYVRYDEDQTYQVSTRVAGWVEKLAVKAIGDPVKKGQLLFELYSPELVNAQQEYLTALKSKSTVLEKASRQRLAALGISSAEIKQLKNSRNVNQRIRVYAKMDGIVTQLAIREGAHIMPASQTMSIASLQHVWIEAEIFERQSSWVKQGQRAIVTLDSQPGKSFTSEVDYIYPELESTQRTLKVRMRFDNKDEIFRPNMFVRVKINGAKTEPVNHISKAALIRGGRIDRVILDLGDGQFKAQKVVPGREVLGRVEILSGLNEGDRVVTSGQFLIDSESNIEAALENMQMHDHPMSEYDLKMHDKVVHGIDHEHDAGSESQMKKEIHDHSMQKQETSGHDHSKSMNMQDAVDMDHSQHMQMDDAKEMDHSHHMQKEDAKKMDHSHHMEMQ